MAGLIFVTFGNFIRHIINLINIVIMDLLFDEIDQIQE